MHGIVLHYRGGQGLKGWDALWTLWAYTDAIMAALVTKRSVPH